MKARAFGLFLASALLAGCIAAINTSQQPVPEPPPPPVPPRFKAEAPPALVASPVEGCQAAPSLDPNLYYCAADEHWFRFAMNRWYLAFAWDGNWFPVNRGELPDALAKITPETKQETTKTREERLQELERKLEKLDEKEQTP
ncbi:MAG: hypothetical protein ACRDMZ_24975 [Solirubrobacteraceae bacterium]